MLLQRIYHDGLAQAAYLLGCQATGDALIVDPTRQIDRYRDAAAAAGLRITAVTETHIHADFVSGARALAARTGARLYLSGAGPAAWQYAFAAEDGATLLRDGNSFRVGNLQVDVLHTPGHTPEHLAFLVTDRAGADGPIGLFSGDFVFVGDVGRPDLLQRAAGLGGTAEPGARQLYASLQRFRALPEYLQVWPGHGAGSACGKALGAVPQTTVGYETRFSWAFRVPDEAAFVAEVLAGQPEPPPYFAEMKRINRDGPSLDAPSPPPRGTADSLAAALAAGWSVADVRPADAFATAHRPGTLSLPLANDFLAWAGWLLPYDAPFGLIVEEADLPAVQAELRVIGLEDIAAYWTPEDALAGRTAGFARATAAQLASGLAANGHVLLDVRRADEYAAGHIPGSRNIPLGHLREHLAAIPADMPLVVYCAGGTRSPIAAALLNARDGARVVEMRDGFDAWAAAGYPVAR